MLPSYFHFNSTFRVTAYRTEIIKLFYIVRPFYMAVDEEDDDEEDAEPGMDNDELLEQQARVFEHINDVIVSYTSLKKLLFR